MLVATAAACVGAVSWALYLYMTYFWTVYWNLGANSHLYTYLQPALFAVTLSAALASGAVAVRSLRMPGTARGASASVVLVLLLALTLWSGASILLGRAYAD